MEAEKQLLDELTSVGLVVRSVYDLVNTAKPYPAAIPVLVKFLRSDDLDTRIMEGVVRALTVKEAKGIANESLIQLYNETPPKDELFRWAVGNAIAFVMQEKDLPSVLDLIRSKENGISRQMLVMGLGKFRDNREVEILLTKLLGDPDVELHAITALTQLRSRIPYDRIEKMAVFSHRPAVKKEARRYLKKMSN